MPIRERFLRILAHLDGHADKSATPQPAAPNPKPLATLMASALAARPSTSSSLLGCGAWNELLTPEQLAEAKSRMLFALPTAPSTQPAKAEEHSMSFLSAVGKDIKGVFAWLGSAKGQQVIASGENLAIIGATAAGVGPAATGIITIANTWLTEIIKTEALATAAGQQTGSGTMKAALVIADVSPEVLAFAKQHGLPTPTADQLTAASNGLVAFLNAFGAPVPTSGVPSTTISTTVTPSPAA